MIRWGILCSVQNKSGVFLGESTEARPSTTGTGVTQAAENILTFDVEEWYERNDVQIPREFTEREHVSGNVNRLLDMLDEHGARATFFCLGHLVKDDPEMPRKIHRRGHEVGLHHLYHNLLYDYSPEEFRQEIREGKRIVEDAIDDEVLGFRAPSWSIDERNLWALEILADEGFQYDSSLFPVKNHLYGMHRGPTRIHTREEGDLVEVPPTVYEVPGLGLRIPFASGFFFRMMPGPVVRHLIRRLNARQRPVVLSLHPWEVFPDFERPPLPPHKAVIPYARLDSCGQKLETVLEGFEFRPVKDVAL